MRGGSVVQLPLCLAQTYAWFLTQPFSKVLISQEPCTKICFYIPPLGALTTLYLSPDALHVPFQKMKCSPRAVKGKVQPQDLKAILSLDVKKEIS